MLRQESEKETRQNVYSQRPGEKERLYVVPALREKWEWKRNAKVCVCVRWRTIYLVGLSLLLSVLPLIGTCHFKHFYLPVSSLFSFVDCISPLQCSSRRATAPVEEFLFRSLLLCRSSSSSSSVWMFSLPGRTLKNIDSCRYIYLHSTAAHVI